MNSHTGIQSGVAGFLVSLEAIAVCAIQGIFVSLTWAMMLKPGQCEYGPAIPLTVSCSGVSTVY